MNGNKTHTSNQPVINELPPQKPSNVGQKEPIFLTERDLSRRWSVSVKLLQLRRRTGDGVPYVKLGRLVRYRLEEVVAYEEANYRLNTSEEG